MTMTDPLADMLARVKNALAQRQAEVRLPASNLKKAVLNVLTEEGYLLGFAEETAEHGPELVVRLKYYQGQPVITRLSRVSRPGQRKYSPAQDIPSVANGLGVTVVSTSKGILSDTKARALNVGGEVLCQVF